MSDNGIKLGFYRPQGNDGDSRVIYEKENQMHYVCRIRELDDCYELAASRGRAKFSKDDKALAAVISHVEQYGIPQIAPTVKMGFVFRRKIRQTRRWQHVVSLAKVVYAAYEGKDPASYKGRRLQYLDGDENNLMRDNLALYEKISVDVTRIADRPYIRLKCQNHAAIADYDKELYEIVRNLHWQFDKEGCVFRHARYKDSPVYFHQLIWAYWMGKVRGTAWPESLETSTIAGWSIDHKKSGPVKNARWDNRMLNLQMIPAGCNSKKGSCTRQMQPNTFYLPTAHGALYGRYQIETGEIEVCASDVNTTSDSVADLRYFCKTGDFTDNATYHSYGPQSPEWIYIIGRELDEFKLYKGVFEND